MFGFGKSKPKVMVYTPDVKATRVQCCLCQHWKGERWFDARVGRVHYEASSSVPACVMNVRRHGAYTATCCRGFVRWCELP